jgi:hypothetical protein
MHLGNTSASLLVLLAVGGSIGCGDDSGGTGSGSGGGDSGAVASTGTAVPGGPGLTPKIEYPPGPYGVGKNSVIQNFSWVGYTQPQVDKSTLELVSLADYWNPTGDGVFPDDGRKWAGLPKPKVLAIVVAAYWCQPCRQEAQYLIPAAKLQFEDAGGGFLQLLSDGAVQGETPVLNELNLWTASYDTSFPALLDATGEFQKVWEADAYPQNIMIRTSDMRIIERESGAGLDCAVYDKPEACTASGFCTYLTACGDAPVAADGCYALGCETDADCGGTECNPTSFTGPGDSSCQDAPPDCDIDVSPDGTENDIYNNERCACEPYPGGSYWKTFAEALAAP